MAQSQLLRPWPVGEKKPTNLGDFIGRISYEREGFRNVPSEAQLSDEIKAQAQVQETAQPEDETMSESGDDVTDEAKALTVAAAREEVFKNLQIAHDATMMNLDFVSLLLSKEMPVQATTTLSPALRDMAGIGTLGASKLKDSTITEARLHDDITIAGGWRLMDLETMVDSVLDAAEKLEREMALEATYWNEVLAVSEKGWAVCSLPYEPHTLGVRFGFPETAPEFRNSSIAPLRRNDDTGSVWLATGPAGAGSQRVRATILKEGKVVGVSRMPRRLADDAPLENRVLEARNTIFSQELWHEINREARTLLGLGCTFDQSSITWDVQPGTKLVFTLEDLSGAESPTEHLSHNWVADSVALCLHLLLSNAHRQNHNRRAYPQPLSANRTNPHPVQLILRFIIARAQHMIAYIELYSFLRHLVGLLRNAGVSTASYTISHGSTNSRAMVPQARRASKAENLANRLISGMELFAETVFGPETRLLIRGFTQPGPYVGHRFMIQVPPTIHNSIQVPGQQQQQVQPNSLEVVFSPSGELYNGHLPLMEYLVKAVPRLLASHLTATMNRRSENESSEGTVTWSESLHGPYVSVDGDVRKAGGVLNVFREAGAGQLALRLDAQWMHRAAIVAAGALNDDSPRSASRKASWFWVSDGTGNAAGRRLEDLFAQILGGA